MKTGCTTTAMTTTRTDPQGPQTQGSADAGAPSSSDGSFRSHPRVEPGPPYLRLAALALVLATIVLTALCGGALAIFGLRPVLAAVPSVVRAVSGTPRMGRHDLSHPSI